MLNYSLKKEDSSKFILGHYYDEERDIRVIEFGDGHEETEHDTEEGYNALNNIMEQQVRDCDQFERKLNLQSNALLGIFFISLVISTIGYIKNLTIFSVLSFLTNVGIIYRTGKVSSLLNDIEKNRYYLLHKEQFQTLEQHQEEIAIIEPKLIPVLETLEGEIDINCIEEISLDKLKKLRASLVTTDSLETAHQKKYNK